MIGKQPRSDWAKAEANVRRLRKRIFRAAQEGDLKKVRNLQKLMLRSHSNLVVSVRRVTQKSRGKKTAGVDGEIALTPSERQSLRRRTAGAGRPRGRSDHTAQMRWRTARRRRRGH
ncbi:reverse transcriptase N-terminal domain-containing protein [Streptomyces cyaneofuscatus]|uniref:reverse transcriptase N-terminal domain-containing protein n=1 Tax=Streptomyces cyaneofuscatus TaxID=66883 RepID=UPI0036909FF4